MTDEHIFGQLAPIKSRGKRLLIDLEGQRCLESINQEKFTSANGFHNGLMGWNNFSSYFYANTFSQDIFELWGSKINKSFEKS